MKVWYNCNRNYNESVVQLQ